METVTHVAGRLKQDLMGCHNQMELSGKFTREVHWMDMGGIRRIQLLRFAVGFIKANLW